MIDNMYVVVVVAMLGVFMLVLLVIMLHIKNQNKLLYQKRQIVEVEIAHQKELTHTLIVSQEAERKRIGMDLHDEVGTALSTLRLLIEQAAMMDNKEPLLKQESKQIIDTVIQNVRKISHNLSPFLKGAYELPDALDDMIGHVSKKAGIATKINYGNVINFDSLNEEKQLALYRIISELINNTIKHAKASEIAIHFSQQASSLMVNYMDNGIGIAQNSIGRKGIGLMNIESRAAMMNANCNINSTNSKGFNLQLTIPI